MWYARHVVTPPLWLPYKSSSPLLESIPITIPLSNTAPDMHVNSEEAIRRLYAYRDAYAASITKDNFDYRLWQTVKVLSASFDSTQLVGKATFTLDIPSKYHNAAGDVHGGAIATLLDGFTSSMIGLAARKGFWQDGGTTRNLSVAYIRPVKAGDKVIVECEMVHLGDRLATIRATMKRQSDGKALAMCLQEKFSSTPRARL